MPGDYMGTEVFGRQPRQSSNGAKRATSPVRDYRPRNLLGVLAFCAAVFTAVVTTIGIVTAMAGHYDTGTWLAYLATGTSVVSVLCGAAAVVTRRGRGWGAVAVMVGALASPPILTNLLGWMSGLG